jgi:hypothetical protein
MRQISFLVNLSKKEANNKVLLDKLNEVVSLSLSCEFIEISVELSDIATSEIVLAYETKFTLLENIDFLE